MCFGSGESSSSYDAAHNRWAEGQGDTYAYMDSQVYNQWNKVTRPIEDNYMRGMGSLVDDEIDATRAEITLGGVTATQTARTAAPAADAAITGSLLETAQNVADTRNVGLQEVSDASGLLLDRETSDANRSLLPSETFKTATGNLLQGETNDAARTLVQPQTEYTRGMIQQGIQENQMAAPVMQSYYKQALTGVDPNQRVREARSDVAQGFAERESAAKRTDARYGVAPGSNRSQASQTALGIEKAKAIGGAMSTARNKAEEENFQRLEQAAGVNTERRL